MVQCTCYRLRAECDLSILHGTFVAIEKTIGTDGEAFRRAADLAGPSSSAVHQWVLFAGNHWPEPLFRAEHLMAIGAFDTYMKSVLLACWFGIKRRDFRPTVADWEEPPREFKAWLRPLHTQNVGGAVDALGKLGIRPELDDGLVAKLKVHNETRNQIAHSSDYTRPYHPESAHAWTKSTSPYRNSLTNYTLGTVSGDVMKAVWALDRSVVEAGVVDDAVLAWTS